MLSATYQRSIIGTVEKISNSTFNESDIKLLLIDIRELIANNSFTKELAHFIAHPERERGLCYEELNIRAFVTKQAIKQTRIFPAPAAVISIKKDLFEILTGIGLTVYGKIKGKRDEDTKRKKIISLYEYNKKSYSYILKDIAHLTDAADIIGDISEHLIIQPVITDKELIKDLNREVKNVYKKYIPAVAYKDEILSKGDDIILYIFSLFQDAQFKTFDGAGGRFNVQYDDNKPDIQNLITEDDLKNPSPEISEVLANGVGDSFLSLHGIFPITHNITMTSAFITSSISLKNYVPKDSILNYINTVVSLEFAQRHKFNLFKEFHIERDTNNKPWVIVDKIS